MAVPKARNVISRKQHYCPHCFNSGGTGAVAAASGGVWPYPETEATTTRHGICGDPAGNFEHAGPGEIVETYVEGGQIEIEIGITAHHNGHFEFYLCDTADLPDKNGDVTQECLNRHKLTRSSGVQDSHPIDPNHRDRYYLDPKCSMQKRSFPDSGIEAYGTKMTFDLPKGLTCEHCVLQWYWVTANSCLAPGYREYFGGPSAPTTFSGCSGDGGSNGWWAPHLGDCRGGSYPEEFWNCADIKISPNDGSTPPARPTAPPTSPPVTVITSPPSTAGEPDNNGGGGDGAMTKRVVAYVPNWKACPSPEQLKQYTHALIAFAVTYPAWKPAGQDTCGTDRMCQVQSVPGCGGKTLTEMVTYLHQNGVEAILSFGGASMGGVWEAKGAAGSNSCWEHCLGKVDSLVSQLQRIVQQSGADGIDVDYEYFLDEPKYRNFLSDFTAKLRQALPRPLLLTHAPMDPDLCTKAINSGCRREYYDILKQHSSKLDFIMPQYYNGYQRPVQDFASTLRHYNALVSDVFQGDASKVVFGFCVSDCTGFNVDAASALGVVRQLTEAVPENGGAMFWESSADSGGAWSRPIAQYFEGNGGGGGGTNPPTISTSPPPSSPPPITGDDCSGEPCLVTGHCRSEWGWCGNGASYCNTRSTWSPSCLLGDPVTPPPTTTTTAPLLPSGSIVEQHGKLRLDGVQLVGEGGEAVQLLGMSSHGLHWFKSCYTKESIAHLVEQWGITLFRAAMYVGENGFATNPSVKATVENIVQWTEELGVYVLIDFHVLTPGDPNHWLDGRGASTGLAIDFWKEMATKYVDKKHVLYEIANEPNNVDWPTVKAYHDSVIGAIRKIDAETIIVAGTTTWSQDIHLAAQNPVSAPYNVMYAFHFYAGTHRSLIQRVRDTATKIPVFSTEWGTSQASGDGGPYLDVAKEFLDVFAEFKISWAQWSYADKAEVSAALNPGACSSKNWDDTSVSGMFVKNYIKQALGGDGVTQPPTSPISTKPPTKPPTSSTKPPATAPPTFSNGGGCEHRVEYTVQNAWNSGHNVDLTITAGPSGLKRGWDALWVLNEGNRFSQGWNGEYEFEEASRTVRAKPASWIAELAPGASATLGFTILGKKPQQLPATVFVAGDACGVGGNTPPPTTTDVFPTSPTQSPTLRVPPPTTTTDPKLIAQIIVLLEKLRDSGGDEAAKLAQDLIDKLKALGPEASITPVLAQEMTTALLMSYPGRGLPPNDLDENSQAITDELLNSLSTTSVTSKARGEGDSDGSIMGLSVPVFVGAVAGVACAAMAVVGLAVVLAKKRRQGFSSNSDGKLPVENGDHIDIISNSRTKQLPYLASPGDVMPRASDADAVV